MTENVADACDIFDAVNTHYLAKEFLAILDSTSQNKSVPGFLKCRDHRGDNHDHIVEYQDKRTKRRYTMTVSVNVAVKED